MGHPMAPFVLLLLLCPASPLSPVSPTPPASPCFTVPPDAPLELNLTQTIPHCTELDWGRFQRQRRLWLNHNGIEALSPSSRVQPGLEELDLSHNALRELPAPFLSGARGLRKLLLRHNRLRVLPDGFFANSTALESLWLDGNPLPAVPRSAFQPGLRFLAVPCRCDVVGSVLAPCACSPAACRCHCLDPQRGRLNVTQFHGSECRGRAALAAGAAAAAALVVLALVAAAVVWHRRRAAAAGVGGAKREPAAAAAHGQPRYVSRADGTGGSNGSADGSTPDYENVLVSTSSIAVTVPGWTPGGQRYSPQIPMHDQCSLHSEDAWDQPIYANTQSPCQDSIYITPDQ
ncbi:leucine-rich repeat-containing protein 25-like [Neopsephotus bourkii]|uniref:leucine-rich repeat-containing protein 25-like n=1 Tax=Neopsephotus bourkii TaxID=309878 RepID=UPI002AA5336E|nr:leucine-rich repeat-containing protein 25-like [Neopsephotus bourkii]